MFSLVVTHQGQPEGKGCTQTAPQRCQPRSPSQEAVREQNSPGAAGKKREGQNPGTQEVAAGLPGEEGESRAVRAEAPRASAHLSVACPAAPQALSVPLCSAPQDGVGVREALPGLPDPALLPTGTQVSLTLEEEALLHPLPHHRIRNNSGSLASTCGLLSHFSNGQSSADKLHGNLKKEPEASSGILGQLPAPGCCKGPHLHGAPLALAEQSQPLRVAPRPRSQGHPYFPDRSLHNPACSQRADAAVRAATGAAVWRLRRVGSCPPRSRPAPGGPRGVAQQRPMAQSLKQSKLCPRHL